MMPRELYLVQGQSTRVSKVDQCAEERRGDLSEV